MTERFRSLQSPVEWSFAALVTLLVVLDGATGLAYAGTGVGAVLRAAWPPIPAGSVWLLTGALALCAAVLGSAAAGLRSAPYASVAVVAVPAAVVYGVTGLLLPWDQLSFWLAQGLLELVVAIPVVGDPLAVVLFGGVTLSAATLERAFLLHYGILAVVAVGAVGVGGRRVRESLSEAG